MTSPMRSIASEKPGDGPLYEWIGALVLVILLSPLAGLSLGRGRWDLIVGGGAGLKRVGH